jgi:phage tail sheath protein FI
MPGIIVTTAVRTGPTNTQTAATATMFVVGVTERGPDGTSHLVTSISDFQDIFGGYVSDGWTYQTVETFFEEGGARAYVSRVVDESAVEADLDLLDEYPSGSVSVNLLASGTGTWANDGNLTATVTNPSLTTFKVTVALDGTTVWSSQTHSSVANFVEEVNNDPAAALYLTASAGVSTSIPAAQAAQIFENGTNGSALVDADVETAIATFTSNLGPGAICAPGFTSLAVREALLDHAAENNRIAIMAFGKDDSVNEVLADITDYSDNPNAQFGAFFYPWVKIPNGNLTSVVPPEGYVCGKRAKVQNLYGSWSPYAGERTQADFVTGVYSSLSKSEADLLDAGFINPVRVINGTVRVYGARSASEDTANYRFIIAREVLNQITYEAEQALEALLFLPIDGRKSTFSRVQATLTAIMDRIRIGGGLYEAFSADGKQIDPGYTVQVNDANNPLTQLATGVIKAKVGARVSSIGDKIEVEITKSNLTATLV